MNSQPVAPRATQENVATTSIYELFLGVLTVISLVTMALLYTLELFAPDSPVLDVLWAADTLFCVIFLFDFLRNLIAAREKREYLLWQGVFDLLGSLPSIPALRLARLARFSRVVRFLRARRGRSLAREFFGRRAESALYVTGLLAVLLLMIGSSLILWFESDAGDTNITTGGDAFWWAYVTITTVGYGDHFPVTQGGRIVGMVLMTFGIGIFGVLTSFMSSVFLSPRQERAESSPSATATEDAGQTLDAEYVRAELVGLRNELAEVRRLLEERNQRQLI